MDERVVRGTISWIQWMQSPCLVEWKIPGFFPLPKEQYSVFYSPSFPYLGGTWHLRCWLSYYWLELLLQRVHWEPDRRFGYRLGIRREDERIYASLTDDCDFERDDMEWGPYCLVRVSDLLRDYKLVAPKNDLTFFCTLQSSEFASFYLTKSSGKDGSTQVAEKDFRNSEKESDVGAGKDVATQTMEEDFRNSEEQSDDSEETSHTLAGTWQTMISQLYDSKECSDVRLVVNEQAFKAHRLVLVIRSPEFRRLLTGANAASDTYIVEEEKVTKDAFDIMLRFLYKDTLETTDKISIIEIYYCALAYHVQDLQDKCEEEMITWNITPDEVCTLLNCGLDVPSLRNRCTDLLRNEGVAALCSPTFLQISLRTLRFLLQSNALENIPALQRIEKILEWCGQRNLEESNYTSARNELLGDGTNYLLGKLGLQNLELDELARVVDIYHGLITPEEVMSFLNFYYTQDASFLPDWCLPVSIVSLDEPAVDTDSAS